MKKSIAFTIIGVLIGTTLTVCANYVFTASDIEYSPEDTEWNVENVSDALSGLRDNINDINDLTSKGFIIYPSGSVNLVANNDDSLYTCNSTVLIP